MVLARPSLHQAEYRCRWRLGSSYGRERSLLRRPRVPLGPSPIRPRLSRLSEHARLCLPSLLQASLEAPRVPHRRHRGPNPGPHPARYPHLGLAHSDRAGQRGWTLSRSIHLERMSVHRSTRLGGVAETRQTPQSRGREPRRGHSGRQ